MDDVKQCRNQLFNKMFKIYYNIPNEWNEFINLHDSNSIVDTEKYGTCVLEAKNAILQAANEKEIDIEKDKFLDLTFQELSTEKQLVGKTKIKTSLYQIQETAIHICEKFKYLLLNEEQKRTLLMNPDQKKRYVENIKMHIHHNPTEKVLTEDEIYNFYAYSLQGVVVRAIEIFMNRHSHTMSEHIKKQIDNFFLCDGNYLNSEVGVCVLLLYVSMISLLPDKGAKSAPKRIKSSHSEPENNESSQAEPEKNNESSQVEPGQKRSIFGRVSDLFSKKPHRVGGGKKSRAKKRRNRKTSRRCK